MNKSIKILSFITFLFFPLITLGSTNPITVIGFEKEEYLAHEEASLRIEVSGVNQVSYPVDIYVDDMKNEGYKIKTIDLANLVSTYALHETINLANHGIFKSGDYFNIFICKSGTKCNLQDKSTRANILAATNLHVALPDNVPSVDIKVNGKDKLSSIKWDKKMTVTWKSKNSTDCSASGNYLPDTNGGFWAGESPLDKTTENGVAPFYSNLQPSGKVEVFAHPTNLSATEISLAITCVSDSLYQVTEEIKIPLKGSAKKEFKKPTPIPLLDITSPKEGQVWNLGKKQKIKWSSKDVVKDIEIGLYSLDESMMCDLGRVPKNKKSFSFTPLHNFYCDSGLILKPGQYMIEIRSGNSVSQLNPIVIK